MESLSSYKLGSGSGSRISFWHHQWVGNTPLKVSFAKIFQFSPYPRGNVSDFWDKATDSCKVVTRQFLKDEEIDEFADLLSVLSSITPVRRFWILEPSGAFSVASLCKPCCPPSMPKVLFDAIVLKGSVFSFGFFSKVTRLKYYK